MISSLNSTPISYPKQPKEPLQKKSKPSTYVNVSLIVGTLLLLPLVVTELFQILKEGFKSSRLESLTELESRVSSKFGAQLQNLLGRVQNCCKKQMIPGLAEANDSEVKMLQDLAEQFDITEEQFVEIGRGAHVRLDDNGKAYEDWKKSTQASARHSSHPADSTQYGLQGKFVKEFLFSRVTENGKTYSWFQFEKNPTRFGYLIRHMVDFMKYKQSGLNQGPYGQSVYTDKNPLVLKHKK